MHTLPIFIHVDQDGNILEMNNSFGHWPDLETMQKVKSFVLNFLKKNNNKMIENYNEGINRLREIKDKEFRHRIKELPIKVNFCYIYLVRDKVNGFYKIGRSRNVDSRLRQLKTSNASIELVRQWTGIPNDEKYLHEIFSTRGIEGEWFDLERDHLQQIEDFFNNKKSAL